MQDYKDTYLENQVHEIAHLPILIQIPQFEAYEDGIMVVSGVYALVDWLLRGRIVKSSL